MPNTKIVATLGPATDSLVPELLRAGVDVFRLNASHGTRAEHAARIGAIRRAAGPRQYPAVLLDLQGPKIRLGQFEGGGCVLAAGSDFTITVEPVLGNCSIASTTYPDFARDVVPGNRILLADGSVELSAVESDGTRVRT